MRPLHGAPALLLAALLTACGGGSTGGVDVDPGASDSAAAEASASAAAEASESAAAERDAKRRQVAQAKYDKCNGNMGSLLDSLSEINSRLNIGLSFNEYSDYVGDSQVEYDRAMRDLDATDGDCLTVGIGLEGALNQHIKAFNTWNECIDDIDCDFSDGPENDRVQRNWLRASELTERADENLRELQP